MNVPLLVAQVEARFDKDFKEALIDLCEQYGTATKVAEALGTTRQTLHSTLRWEHLSWKDVQLLVLNRQRHQPRTLVHIPPASEPVPHG